MDSLESLWPLPPRVGVGQLLSLMFTFAVLNGFDMHSTLYPLYTPTSPTLPPIPPHTQTPLSYILFASPRLDLYVLYLQVLAMLSKFQQFSLFLTKECYSRSSTLAPPPALGDADLSPLLVRTSPLARGEMFLYLGVWWILPTYALWVLFCSSSFISSFWIFSTVLTFPFS